MLGSRQEHGNAGVPAGLEAGVNGHRPAASLGDAACFYRRRNRAGDFTGLTRLDGATIFPLVDACGKPAEGDGPAYMQMVNGLPWNWLTRDDLVVQYPDAPECGAVA